MTLLFCLCLRFVLLHDDKYSWINTGVAVCFQQNLFPKWWMHLQFSVCYYIKCLFGFFKLICFLTQTANISQKLLHFSASHYIAATELGYCWATCYVMCINRWVNVHLLCFHRLSFEWSYLASSTRACLKSSDSVVALGLITLYRQPIEKTPSWLYVVVFELLGGSNCPPQSRNK